MFQRAEVHRQDLIGRIRLPLPFNNLLHLLEVDSASDGLGLAVGVRQDLAVSTIERRRRLAIHVLLELEVELVVEDHADCTRHSGVNRVVAIFVHPLLVCHDAQLGLPHQRLNLRKSLHRP